jgi:hypothetical protein
MSAEQQVALTYEFYKIIDKLSKDYRDFVQDLTGTTSKSIEALALYAATYKAGSVSQQLLGELESKSWVKGNEAAVYLAKKVIMREMILKGRPNLAEDYLRKCLISFSTQFSLLGRLLQAYSGFIKKHYTSPQGIEFLLEQVKKASVSGSDKLWSNLSLFIQVTVPHSQ